MKSIVFNPEYHLRQDGNMVILFSDDEVSDLSQDWFSFIHPFHAMMFSFFDGQGNYLEQLDQCASFFNIPLNRMEEIVGRFLSRQQWFAVRSGGRQVNFPKNVLLEVEQGGQSVNKRYSPNDFKYIGTPDYDTVRLAYPIGINMELTMKCYANCVYCYANRNLRDKSMLTMSEIRNVVAQAKQNGVYKIDVNGGDVLLHPNIKEILQVLVDNGYSPLVSTKAILTRDMLDYVMSLGKVRLQISLDSVDKNVLHRLIGVPDNYIADMSLMLEYLSERQTKIQVNVVLTKYNSDIVGIKRLLDYLDQYSVVKEVRFSPCGCSLYKNNFEELVLPAKQMQAVLDKVQELAQKYPDLNIKVSSFDKKDDYISETKETAFQGRALCTGGTRNVVLLPNGDMTICEELYDNSHFVLGNVRKNTIEEVWNSQKAIELYSSPIKESSMSPCNSCVSKKECRTNVGVCWKLVIMAYGTEQWDYLDPRCPRAPLPFNKFYYD